MSVQVTEQNARNYYRRYLSYLRGADWDTLLGGPNLRAAAE